MGSIGYATTMNGHDVNDYVKSERAAKPKSTTIDEVDTPGSRHILQLITHIAKTDPSRIYAAIPISPTDLSKGFRDISYAEFNNAINHCVRFLNDILPEAKERYEVVGYAGPKDIRYPIMTCALAKLEKRFLFVSAGVTPAGQTNLVDKTGCRVYLYGGDFHNHVQSITESVNWDVSVVGVPEVEELLTVEKAEDWPWEKNWDEVRYTPWVIGHSSGTTGLPKPMEYTHQMMANVDSVATMPDADEESLMKHIPGRRWYSPLLTMHMVGLYVALQFTCILGGVAVFGHSGDTSPMFIRDTLRYGNCQAIVSPPFFLEAMEADPIGLEVLRGLDYVYFAGAPLSQNSAEKLLPYTRVMPVIGTTEAGMYFVLTRDEEDWEYYTFRPSNGIEFEHLDGKLHELVFRRKPELQRYQQIFHLFPDAGDEFRTGDVWTEHPSKRGAWKMVGRTDDLVVLSHGKKMNAAQVELELTQCPGVGGVVVGGHSRARPFVLVEWKEAGIDQATMLGQFWPAVEKINEGCHELVRMQRELILFTASEKKLTRNVKGGTSRRASEKLYAEDIERMYTGFSV